MKNIIYYAKSPCYVVLHIYAKCAYYLLLDMQSVLPYYIVLLLDNTLCRRTYRPVILALCIVNRAQVRVHGLDRAHEAGGRAGLGTK